MHAYVIYTYLYFLLSLGYCPFMLEITQLKLITFRQLTEHFMYTFVCISILMESNQLIMQTLAFWRLSVWLLYIYIYIYTTISMRDSDYFLLCLNILFYFLVVWNMPAMIVLTTENTAFNQPLFDHDLLQSCYAQDYIKSEEVFCRSSTSLNIQDVTIILTYIM